MSQSIKRIIHEAEQVSPDEARAYLESARQLAQDKPLYYKGVDIAHRVLQHLSGEQPIEQLQPPIFSVNSDEGETLGFTETFGVDGLSTIGDSPHIPAGFSLVTETVDRPSNLSEREFPFMYGRLPAVRITFVPEE